MTHWVNAHDTAAQGTHGVLAVVLAILPLVQFALFVFSKYLDALVPLYFEMCGLQRLRMKSGPIVEYTCPGFRGRNMLNILCSLTKPADDCNVSTFTLS